MYRQAQYDEPLLFEYDSSCKERDEAEEQLLGSFKKLLPPEFLREDCFELPDLAESEVVRHYTRLSQMNFGVDSGFYPLGSCTMKYNPKLNEEVASHPLFCKHHPDEPEEFVQGTLKILYELQEYLKEIGGVDAVTLQPSAGAQGEFTGMLITRKYHENNGEERDEVILPDTSHGTNPASAKMGGFKIVQIESNDEGCVDLEALRAACSDRTAAFMLTNPNTLGIFEKEVHKLADIVHGCGALMYYDGANFNAILGRTNPVQMGFDIVHFNLHKTFSSPHGGGGPGSGAVGVVKRLASYLPVPLVAKKVVDGKEVYYNDYSLENSIGKVHPYFGNVGVLIRAYAYIKVLGKEGLRDVTNFSVLNSNYLREKLSKYFKIPYPGLRKHEFVLSGDSFKEHGFDTAQAAKKILDTGFHAPTVYFPLIVHEAMMIEPTESESKDYLDTFSDILIKLKETPAEDVARAPESTPVGKLDQTFAAKHLILNHKDYIEKREQL